MPSTYETLRADIITAMKARDTATATALRTMDAAIQRAAMDTSKPIDEALSIATFRKAVKNLTDARTEFEKPGAVGSRRRIGQSRTGQGGRVLHPSDQLPREVPLERCA